MSYRLRPQSRAHTSALASRNVVIRRTPSDLRTAKDETSATCLARRSPLTRAPASIRLPHPCRAPPGAFWLGAAVLRGLGADAFEEGDGGFVGGILGDELAAEGFGERCCAEVSHVHL